MKVIQSSQAKIVLSAALMAILAIPVRAKIVTEQDIQPGNPPTAAGAQDQDRANLRQALSTSEKAKATAASTVYIEPSSPQAPGQVQDQNESQPEVQNFSKAELTRRQRMREELRNEDGLQTRLEELRLRDEQRRTQEIMGGEPLDGGAQGGMEKTAAAQAQPETAPVAMIPVQEQAVVSPVTEHPGRPGALPPGTPYAANAYPGAPGTAGQAPANMTDVGGGTSQASAFDGWGERMDFSVQPRIGIANMTGSDTYNIHSRFSAGFGLDVATSEHISFELGYQYAEYGVALGNANPFALGYQPYGGGGPSQDGMTMKQNVVDAGLKLHLFGPEAKLRPYIGGGGGYAKSYINYNQATLAMMRGDPFLQGFGSDYELSQFLGYVSLGLDFRVSNSVSVGLLAKYYAVLASNESQNLNNLAFYGGGPGALYQPTDYNKQYVGGSLANTSFYSLMGNMTVTF